MKKRFEVYLTGFALLISWQIGAQSFVDNALTFSRTRPIGSARVQAIGGAQISIGGDYSSLLANPAGLGMYNRSELTFSPALNFYNSSSSYLTTFGEDSKTIFNIPGASLVYHSPRECECGFKNGSFGISVERINDFNNVFQYSGRNSQTSIIDSFLEDADGTDVEDLNFDHPIGLAFDNYLLQDSAFFKEYYAEPINPQDYAEYYSLLGIYPDDPDDIRTVSRSENATTKGAGYQVSLGYGGNISDRFFFGASVGITTLRYQFKRTYHESDFYFELDPDYEPLDNLMLEETIDIKGSGVNLTLGAIVRPVNFMQIGISYVTPTYYQLTDNYIARLATVWNNWDYYGVETLTSFDYESEQPTISDYSLSTPMKLSVGTTFFLGKYGFVSGDMEWVNYSKAKYSSQIDEAEFSGENSVIKSLYTDVVNLRSGIELRYKIFRLRGGYSFQANPYKSQIDLDKSIKTVSGGVGVRFEKVYVDFAITQSKWDSIYAPYVFPDGAGPLVRLENKITSSVFTVGLNF